jgi:hypothetical protein
MKYLNGEDGFGKDLDRASSYFWRSCQFKDSLGCAELKVVNEMVAAQSRQPRLPDPKLRTNPAPPAGGYEATPSVSGVAAGGLARSLFSGRWQCTVHGSEALMNQFSFTVNDDGTVFLAGLAEEPRAAITPSSIQFESRGGGTVDSTSLRGNSSRMDGTRTLTTPAMGVVPATNTSHRISCVPSEQRRPPTTTRADAPRSTSESGRPSADQQRLIQDMVASIQKLGGDSAALRVFKSDVASGQISMSQLGMMINTLIQNERDPDIRRSLETIRATLGSPASPAGSVPQSSAPPTSVGRSDSAGDRPGFDRVPGDRDYGGHERVPSGVVDRQRYPEGPNRPWYRQQHELRISNVRGLLRGWHRQRRSNLAVEGNGGCRQTIRSSNGHIVGAERFGDIRRSQWTCVDECQRRAVLLTFLSLRRWRSCFRNRNSPVSRAV